jgi:hypothetical protein
MTWLKLRAIFCSITQSHRPHQPNEWN